MHYDAKTKADSVWRKMLPNRAYMYYYNKTLFPGVSTFIFGDLPMKIASWTACALLTFAANVAAQDVRPVPTPTPDDGQVVKITTNLIQLDVSVLDKKGNVVTDLRRDTDHAKAILRTAAE